MKTLFIVGKSQVDLINKQIRLENDLYGDIIQINFTDNKKSTSFKSIFTWRWIDLYCRDIKYVVKLNDDIVLNTFSLFKYLNELRIDSNTMYCHIFKKYSPILINSTDLSIFHYTVCINSFISTKSLVSKLYNASKYIQVNWIDNENTAVIAKTLQVDYKNIFNFYLPRHFSYLIDQKMFSIFILDCKLNIDFIEIWSKIVKNL